jgi:hypothetical protein
MKENWILKEARKADESKGVAILENPKTKTHLDKLLLNRFWPIIRETLDDSMYNYIPPGNGAGWGLHGEKK